MEHNLHDAICLLALIAQRPRDLNRLLGNIHEQNPEVLASSSNTNDSDLSDSDSNVDEDSNADFEDFEGVSELSNTDGDVSNEVYISDLRNKVLDRLAETLARFKTDRRHKGLALDSKHVASTMMVTYGYGKKVQFICSKNEGLDQENSYSGLGDDTSFLASWKRHIEFIANKGEEALQHKSLLFELLLNYQRRRITFYLKNLQALFDRGQTPASKEQPETNKLTTLSLLRLPQATSKKWEDTEGNNFRFPIHSATGFDVESDVVVTCDSFRDAKADVYNLFDLIQRACCLDIAINNTSPFAEPETFLLKELLETMHKLWKNVRHQSVIKTELRVRLHGTTASRKLEKGALIAMMFLVRIHSSAATFILAAETMPMFKNIKCILSKSQRSVSKSVFTGHSVDGR
ncbi:hypothetical protein K505DRAFT_344417 [Melanomma pulvis-pyrius CBS 109.77]|uniref:Uncharacterized protein n=1 Tax=Melanomma pulvis-pyrius CBS 109.77 TaxID=1314802 RepID=A0A6A6WP27_9PLEO|nr:hypothetical protein K505DRAFT_344417 [Melanomma pulvis-pyrius CBS 109.77]